MSCKHRTRLIVYPFFALLFFSALPSCQVFPSLKKAVRDGLAEGVQQARIDSLMKATADSVLTELVKTERFRALRQEMGAVLSQTTDTLYHAVDTILNKMVVNFTQTWLRQVDGEVQTMLTHAKQNLTDDQIKRYITDLIGRDLPLAFNRLIDQVSGKLRSSEFKADLADLRVFLGQQADSLARIATLGAISAVNDSLLPEIDRLIDKIVEERDRTQKGVTSTVWIILIGIVVLLLIAFLARTYYLKLQYRKMLQVTTQEANKIDSQAAYDKFTRNVSEKMKEQGLEQIFRKDILEEQGLLNQPEWKEKDALLLRVLLEELQGSDLSGAQIREKLKKYGLEEHYESVRKRSAPTK